MENNFTNVSGTSMFSTPQLVKTVVKEDCIELIYKRQYMVSLNGRMPEPEVFKDIYSRKNGGVRREIGVYVPSQSESYVFDSDLI